MKYFLISLLSVLLVLTSCQDALHIMKSTDKNYKFNYAMKWYNQKKYMQSIPMIENILPAYKGTDTAQLLYFYLAESYFHNKDYTVAAYHYKTYKDLYASSANAELASKRLADCYKNDVPRIQLDQTDTEKAIEYYKIFLAEYPNSPLNESVLEDIKALKRRLELKALDGANLYYKTSNFRAAAVTYKNVLNKYPDIQEYEYLLFKICKSYYQFAEKSILSKQAERYEKTITEGQAFLNRFPNSQYKDEIQSELNLSKIKVLEAAYKHASQYYMISERVIYFNEAIGLYNDFSPEINPLPISLHNYIDKCYLGILNSQYTLLEDSKDATNRTQYYNTFKQYYYDYISKMNKNSKEFQTAEELYNKIHQFIKS